MSWFGHITRQNQPVEEPVQEPPPNANDPQNLLVPDPSSEDENEDVAGAPAVAQADNMPTTNYDAQHADDEAAGAMEKAVNML